MTLLWERLREAIFAMENFSGQALAWFNSAFPPEEWPEKIGHWRVSAENYGEVGMAWFEKVLQPETWPEKINYLRHYVVNCGAEGLAWFMKEFQPETWPEKVNYWQLYAENFGRAWFGKVFTPETRAEVEMAVTHWFHISKPYHEAFVALVVLVIFFRFCSGGVVMIVKAPFGLVWIILRALFGLMRMIVKALFGMVKLILFGPVKMMKAPGRNIRIPRAGFESNPKGYFRNLHARQ